MNSQLLTFAFLLTSLGDLVHGESYYWDLACVESAAGKYRISDFKTRNACMLYAMAIKCKEQSCKMKTIGNLPYCHSDTAIPFGSFEEHCKKSGGIMAYSPQGVPPIYVS